MMYRVLVRASGENEWEPYAEPTDDPLAAMRLIQQANQRHVEVTVLQAETPDDLTLLVERVRRGEMAASGSPFPGLTSTPRVSVRDTTWDTRLWELESGPGGDCDQPYQFELPRDTRIVAAWLALMAVHWRERCQAEQPTAGNGEAA